jgi:PhnB protein
MPTIHPHINFNGNAEEAFAFYQSVFGGSFSKLVRFKEFASPEFEVPEAEADKIMHIALPIGNGNILIGNDVPSFLGSVSERENRSKIFVSTANREEAEQLFGALSVGAEVEYPISTSPWGTYYGGLRDKYGIEWEVDFDPRQQAKG